MCTYLVICCSCIRAGLGLITPRTGANQPTSLQNRGQREVHRDFKYLDLRLIKTCQRPLSKSCFNGAGALIMEKAIIQDKNQLQSKGRHSLLVCLKGAVCPKAFVDCPISITEHIFKTNITSFFQTFFMNFLKYRK